MQSLTSVRASHFLQRCCRGPHVLCFQSTEALNSGSHPSYEGKDGSLTDTAKPNNKGRKDVYSEVAADITTTLSDGMGSVTVDRRSKFAFYLPSHVQQKMIYDGFKMRNLPTQRKIPAVLLPADLVSAMGVILKGASKSDLQKQALLLSHKLRDRRVPMERHEWEHKQGILYQGLVDRESVDPMHPNVLEEDRHKLLQDREKAFKLRILTELGNYKPPIDYAAESGCQLYMHTRLPSEFASLVKAFSQLRASLPNFSPSTLLDFGSGVGSVTWAMDRVWPHQCKQTVSIDSSAEMNALNERLLRGGSDDGPLKQRRQHTYFRQFLPASASVKHNLVVMSRTLFDLADAEVRLRTLDILWKTVSPGGCLVLVEDGHSQACQLMLEARHFLLETERSKSSNALRIVAPCPHQFACPLLMKDKKYRICTDSVKYFQYGETGFTSQSTFSYMAFYKPTEEESSQGDSDEEQLKAVWPRIVQPVIKHSSVTTVRVCNKFGYLQELAVVKSKHGTLCRRLAKASNLGDLFPVELLHPSNHVIPQTKIFDKIRETRHDLVKEKLKNGYTTNEEHNETYLNGKEES